MFGMLGRFFIKTFFVILITEACLRLLGVNPVPHPVQDNSMVKIVIPDPILGWRGKPDLNFIHPISGAQITTEHDGSRKTSEQKISSMNELVAIGCSFTHGEAGLDDKETYSWKLQKEFPSTHVRNFGVPAYGSVQSYLLLKEILNHPEYAHTPPRVLYGFVSFHEYRNIAEPHWLGGLTNQTIQPLTLPFGSLIGGALDLSRQDRWVRFPFRNDSAFSNATEESFGRMIRVGRDAEKEEVTLRTIEQMDTLVKEQGGEFTAVLLYALQGRKEPYLTAFHKKGIPAIDCTFPGDSKAHALPFDKHPDGVMHGYWAQCIKSHLTKATG